MKLGNRSRALIWSLTMMGLLGLLLGCSPEPGPGAEANSSVEEAPSPSPSLPDPGPPLRVTTLSPPVDWLVGRLGGDRVERQLLLPDGEEAASWRPSPEQIVAMQEVDLIVASGAGYEAWTAQVSLPLSRFVEAAAGLDLIEVAGRTHSHGAAGEHSHGEIDPRVWMDPDLYAAQARRIHEAFVTARPEAAEELGGALAELESELAELGEGLSAALGALGELPIASSHPSYRYLARLAGLEVADLEMEPSVAPSAARLEAFRRWRADRQVMVWWERPPSEGVRSALGEGVVHLHLDPLTGGDGFDYLELARGNLRRLEGATQ